MNKSLFQKHKRTFSVTDIELVTKLIVVSLMSSLELTSYLARDFKRRMYIIFHLVSSFVRTAY